jgi:hypothetical protein
MSTLMGSIHSTRRVAGLPGHRRYPVPHANSVDRISLRLRPATRSLGNVDAPAALCHLRIAMDGDRLDCDLFCPLGACAVLRS